MRLDPVSALCLAVTASLLGILCGPYLAHVKRHRQLRHFASWFGTDVSCGICGKVYRGRR